MWLRLRFDARRLLHLPRELEAFLPMLSRVPREEAQALPGWVELAKLAPADGLPASLPILGERFGSSVSWLLSAYDRSGGVADGARGGGAPISLRVFVGVLLH